MLAYSASMLAASCFHILSDVRYARLHKCILRSTTEACLHLQIKKMAPKTIKAILKKPAAAVQTPTAAAPGTSQPATEQPPAEQPAAETPPTEQPPAEQPPARAPQFLTLCLSGEDPDLPPTCRHCGCMMVIVEAVEGDPDSEATCFVCGLPA